MSDQKTFGGLGTERTADGVPVELREAMAEQAHKSWSGWMRYMIGKSTVNGDGTCTIPAWAMERWQRQMNTPYEELPEAEKVSDRKEADDYIEVLVELGVNVWGEDAEFRMDAVKHMQEMDAEFGSGVDWDKFSRFVYPALVQVLNRCLDSELVRGVRDREDFVREVTLPIQEISATLEQRGRKYGEDVLFLTGEQGILVLAVTKAMRLLWSMRTGQRYADREDSWLDLAGYCVLAMALHAAQGKV